MAGQIRIRMYRAGFGDCFLITLPSADGSRWILVDCGVHFRGNAGTLDQAVADIETETQGKLDLVIATHVHQDHISGFSTYVARFRAMRPNHVWMPWTDNDGDASALRLAKRQDALVHALSAVRPDHYALNNLAPNRTALDLLRKYWPGAGAKIEFLTAGDLRSPAAGIPGLKASILGPPRDEAFLRQMEPPPGDHYFRAAAAKEAGEAAKPLQPFLDRYKWTPEVPPLDGKFAARLRESILEDPEALAMKLDSVRNNTSLVVLFEYGGRTLLFPGDAEYGNWRAWVEKPEAAEILGKVDFYKVSHHGSYNGTPKSALEKMTNPGLAAMLSTMNKPWPSIPREGLVNRLKEKAGSRLLRTDETNKLYLDYFVPVED